MVDKIIFDATLYSAFAKDGKNKLVISSSDDTLWKLLDEIYKKAQKRWIPEWYKNRDDKNLIVLKSAYDIPFMIEATGEKLSTEDFITRDLIRGAEVKIKCNVKESCLYPSAVKVFTDGEAYDAFADF